MNTNTNSAAILANVDTIDTLAAPASVAIQANKIRECMILVDPELGTPLYWIDHKVRSTTGSGNAEFLAHNLENGHFETVRIFGTTAVKVMAV